MVGKQPLLHVLFLPVSQAAQVRYDWVVPACYTHTRGLSKLSASAYICLHWSHPIPPTHTSMAAALGQYRNTCEHVARRIAPSHTPLPETPLVTLFSFQSPAELSWCSLMFLQGITHSSSPNLRNRDLRSSHHHTVSRLKSILCFGPASPLNLQFKTIVWHSFVVKSIA